MATLEGNQLTVWIAVVGPSGAGKRTTLDKLRARIPGATALVEETTAESQQLIYFEFPVGPWQNFDVRVRMLTLTGQVFYDSDREKLIKGSSGALFVASRALDDRERNEEARQNLDRHVGTRAEAGYPVLLQLNKSDLLNAVLPSSVQLGAHIGDKQITVARTGTGIPELTNAVTDELVPAALMALVVEGILEPVTSVPNEFLAAIGAPPKKPASKPEANKTPAQKKPAPAKKKPAPAKKPAKKKPAAKKKPKR